MDILALTHRTPFPPDKGDRIRSFHLLSRLGREHRVWLCAVDDSSEELRVQEALDSFCHRHAVFHISPARRYLGAAKSLMRGEALTLGWFDHPGVRRTISSWMQETTLDVAYVFSSSMAPYWLGLQRQQGLPAVMDFIDVDSEKWGQYARYSPGPRRWIYAREQRKLALFENRVAAQAAHNLLVSEAEAELFRSLCPGPSVLALANGVDGGHFALPELSRRADPPRMVFVGQMDYHANVDAVCYFADEILPRILERHPDVEFDVVGARPAPRVKALAERPGIVVSGWVEDIRPYLWKATVAVAPLRIAQGTQNKVLEAMAASVPVVCTSLASRGLAQPTGDHLQVEDDPAHFADAVLGLMDHPARARAQIEAGLHMLREHHSWEASTRQLSGLLSEASAGRDS